MKRPALLCLLLVMLHLAVPALAKDGESDSSNSDSGSSGSNESGDDDSEDDDDDEDEDGGDDDSHSESEDRDRKDSDRARDGVSSGRLLPLTKILKGLDSRFSGRLLDANLKQRRGRDIYELQLISPGGRVIELRIDATNGTVLGYRVAE